MKQETQKQVGDLLLWSDESAKQMMIKIAEEHGVSPDALADLVAWQRERQHKKSSRGMTDAFDDVFENKEYWK